MKAAAVIISILFVGSAFAQDITVQGYGASDADNLDKYKTYYWASMVDSDLKEGNIYFLNDLVLKADLRDAIRGELRGRGYTEQKQNPDMIVNFRVFDKPVRLKGYTDAGYGASYWGPTELRDARDTTSYQVEAGTLLISLVDRKSGQMIWQGFASGLIKGSAFLKDKVKLSEARG